MKLNIYNTKPAKPNYSDLSISGDSKQRLLSANELHRSQTGQRLTADGQLDLRPLHSSQLTPVVVTPDPDLTAASPGQRPVIRFPVHRQQECTAQ